MGGSMIDIDKEPQRYHLMCGALGPTVAGGDWVKYEDYLTLTAELRKLRAELNDFTTAAGEMNAEVVRLRGDAERWRTEMALRNDPTVAIMFAGTSNRCSIYRKGVLIAPGSTYVDAIDAVRQKKT
jgi:hypothetical protein